MRGTLALNGLMNNSRGSTSSIVKHFKLQMYEGYYLNYLTVKICFIVTWYYHSSRLISQARKMTMSINLNSGVSIYIFCLL